MADRFRPRLRTILLIVNLAVLVLPLGSLFFFRIYENQLVRQTESELISQAAVLAAAYSEAIAAQGAEIPVYGRKVTPRRLTVGGRYAPVEPQLDLARQQILPKRPHGLAPSSPADEAARKAGILLTRIIIEAQRSTLAGMKILDYNGVAVAGRFETGMSFAHIAEVKKALSGNYASVIRTRELKEPLPPLTGISRSTGIRVFVTLPIIVKDRLVGVAYLSRTPNSILKHMYAERRKVMLAGLTILALTLALALLTSATIARPINRLMRRAERIKSGDTALMQPMDRPGTLEMELLSKSFSDMSISLHERSEYIRDFANHVSHEFKTPLASIQGAAELLDEHFKTMSDKERKRFLANIISDTGRLRQLVTRLLELARADNINAAGGQCRLDQALAELAAKYSDESIAVSVDSPPASTAISQENLEMLLSNLIDNARQHKASQVEITAQPDNDRVVISVCDNGEGISKANMGKIFTPFFTTRRDMGGTGLGLGIVKSIVEAHGGTIRAKHAESGAHFKLTLPIALTVR